jgi:aryl-phospho-beta-D-glucosidase BglC (GH1 family)
MKLRRELGLPVPADEDGTGRATWLEVIGECVDYWQSPTNQGGAGSGMTDAQFDAIMGELSKIKQLLRQLLHG